MNDNTNNKRLAKNTLYLYMRMGVVIIIGFFTTRYALKYLGEENYGLTNVIGSVIVLFSFISNSMQVSCLRYFSKAIGCDDREGLNNYFNITLTIYIVLGIVSTLLCEFTGMLIIENKIDIPPDRVREAVMFFHLMNIGLFFNILLVPFQALVISLENIFIYSCVLIFDVIFKFSMIMMLQFNLLDSLVSYGIIMAFIAFLNVAFYLLYCRKYMENKRYHLKWNGKVGFEILKFSGWNLWGGVSRIVVLSGINILLNNSFGAVVNAARSISMQVLTTSQSFSDGFIVAVNPQIIKSYSSGDVQGAISLAIKTSKIVFFLFLLVALPISIELPFLLNVWLEEVPEYTVVFIHLALIEQGLNILTHPLKTLVQATGKIALYQSVLGIILCLSFPLSWWALKHGYPATSVYWIAIYIRIIFTVASLIIMKPLLDFPCWRFTKQVVIPITLSMLAQTALIWLVMLYVAPHLESWLKFFVVEILTMIIILSTVTLIGLNRDDIKFIMSALKGILGKFCKKFA